MPERGKGPERDGDGLLRHALYVAVEGGNKLVKQISVVCARSGEAPDDTSKLVGFEVAPASADELAGDGGEVGAYVVL